MRVAELRQSARAIFDAAVKAVDPAEAIRRHVVREGTALDDRPGRGGLERRRADRGGRFGQGRGAHGRCCGGDPGRSNQPRRGRDQVRTRAADPDDPYSRGRPSGSRRSGDRGGAGRAGSCEGAGLARPGSGAHLGRRVGAHARAGQRDHARREASADEGTPRMRRGYPRDEHAPQTYLADQGRPACAGRSTCAGLHPDSFRHRWRSVGCHCLRSHGTRSSDLCGRLGHRG